jgi:PEP-CTERM motif
MCSRIAQKFPANSFREGATPLFMVLLGLLCYPLAKQFVALKAIAVYWSTSSNLISRRATNMSKVSCFVFGSLLLLATTAGTATASTITDDVTFNVPFTSGTSGGGAGPSYSGGATPSAVTGSFAITFDPTLTYTNDTAGITETGLTGITSDSAFSFDYSPTSYMIDSTTFAAGELVVGGLSDGACCVAISPSTANDFYLHVLTFSTTPTFQQFGYATSTNDYFYTDTLSGAAVAGAGSVTVTPAGTAVPEPSSLLVLFAGLLALAGASWRKRLRQV